MIQMSAECNCKVQRSMTHMSNTQDVKNNNTHNAQDRNISMQPNKDIFYKLNRVDNLVEAERFRTHATKFLIHAP